MKAFAVLKTDQAPHHLNAMCHHFGCNVEATCNKRDAQIVFAFGRCDLTASKDRLELCAEADDQGCLDQVVEVMSRHVERFAFRENPNLEWRPASSVPPSQ